MDSVYLSQSFLYLNLLKCRFQLSKSGVGLRLCISTRSQKMPMLLEHTLNSKGAGGEGIGYQVL